MGVACKAKEEKECLGYTKKLSSQDRAPINLAGSTEPSDGEGPHVEATFKPYLLLAPGTGTPNPEVCER